MTEPQLPPITDHIARRFAAFHAAHPEVYAAFDKITRTMIARGYERGSAYMVAEVIRWETSVNADHKDFKLNNDYRPLYARMWMLNNPEHADFFRTRVRQYRKDD